MFETTATFDYAFAHQSPVSAHPVSALDAHPLIAACWSPLMFHLRSTLGCLALVTATFLSSACAAPATEGGEEQGAALMSLTA